MWNSLWQDVRYAARLLQQSSGFSAVIIGCLALGIGPTTTTFSLINASLLQPLNVEEPETLVTILANRAGHDRPNQSISYPNYVDLRDRMTTLEAAVSTERQMSVRSEKSSELIGGALVSPNFFDVLGRKPLHGEVFHAPENESPGSQPVIVLGHEYWQQKFGGKPEAVGTTMRINGHDFTVLGVMPADFTGEMPVAQPALWVPTTMMDEIRPDIPSQRGQRNHSWMRPFGRMRSGSDLAAVQKDLADVSRQLASEYPQTNQFTTFTAVRFSGIPYEIVGAVTQIVALAAIVVLMVLLLSCVSTAALQLARATVRRREIAIRMAVGASRWRIVRQLLVESVFLALLAGFVALLFTLWAFGFYKYLLPEGGIGAVLGSSFDWRVLAFTIALSFVTGILFGLAPAWQMSRPDLIAPLKNQDPGGDFGSTRVRNVLVAAQFALAVVLLISAGLFVKGLRQAETLDPGFETQHMVIFDADVSIYKYSMQRTAKFVDEFRERVGKLPGVEAISVSRFPPLSRSSSNTGMAPIGKDLSADKSIDVGINNVGPGYFATVGIPLVAGREFSDTDTLRSPRVAIINESLARHFGGSQAALGKIASGGGGESAEIVGVAKDSKYWSFGEEGVNFAYLAMAQVPGRELAFCVRTSGDAEATLKPLADQIRALDENLALSTLRTVREHTRQSLFPARVSAVLFAILGGLALTLAVIGVYGVVSYSITRRRLEIGVRMALGSQPRDLIVLLVRRGMRLVVIGAAVGIAVAFGITGFLAPLLSGASPTDWQVFVAVPLVLLAVAGLAIYLPARKATRFDPIVVLRYE